jgi:protein-arginine kinase activator protein McsA
LNEKLRINIHAEGEKTEELICNWCAIPHPVDTDYKENVLQRAEEQLQELRNKGTAIPDDVKPEDMWFCGACLLHLNEVPEELAKNLETGCDHEVPNERQKK